MHHATTRPSGNRPGTRRIARSLATLLISVAACSDGSTATGESEQPTATSAPATSHTSIVPTTSLAPGPSDGGWWFPPRWTAAGEEQGATDPLADGRYVGLVTLVSPDTISFDLVTWAPYEADREAAVALALLSPDDAMIDGALINRSPAQRVMVVAADAVLRRLEPFGTANLATVRRGDLAELIELSSARSMAAFHVDVRAGRVVAMDERYHP